MTARLCQVRRWWASGRTGPGVAVPGVVSAGLAQDLPRAGFSSSSFVLLLAGGPMDIQARRPASRCLSRTRQVAGLQA